MANGGKIEKRAEAMRVLLARWERSGLPLSRFAKREGVSSKTMYRWRQRLGVGGEQLRRGRRPRREIVRAPGAAPWASMFTEVSSGLRAAGASAAMVGFEVVLPGGTVVRVPQRFESAALRSLLATLGEC